ncbi:sigma-70 family RNA polymerase sigma factor [Roseateles sp. BYS180W]|uniref:RNA polymerase sigma factor n=1 Tax=Roseateles rivi TaxID=3299028 RepID=A0ABW7FS96_9BURK
MSTRDRDADWLLVQAAQQGRVKAFELLVLKYQQRLEWVVARMLPVAQVDSAPDLVQEALIRAYKALPGFRGDCAFYSWLYRIATNTAKSALMRPQLQFDPEPEMETFEAQAGLNDEGSPDAVLQSKQLAEALDRAMQQLPEEYRSALTLREIEGMSYDEIALALSCPVGTVRSRIFRAREAVAQQLRPLLAHTAGRPWR